MNSIFYQEKTNDKTNRKTSKKTNERSNKKGRIKPMNDRIKRK